MLCEAVRNAEHGTIDADYGGEVIKQRIARSGAGKSGGYRTIILYRRGKRSFFVYGFAKNEQSNIDESDEHDFKELAKVLLEASEEQIENLIRDRKFIEVPYDDQNEGDQD